MLPIPASDPVSFAFSAVLYEEDSTNFRTSAFKFIDQICKMGEWNLIKYKGRNSGNVLILIMKQYLCELDAGTGSLDSHTSWSRSDRGCVGMAYLANRKEGTILVTSGQPQD